MFPKKPELSVLISSKTELLKLVVELTRHVAIINQFSLSDSQKIALAVDEAIINVIAHSYKHKEEETIKLEYFSDDNGLKIKIVFSGAPPVFKESRINLNEMIKAKKKGGLGVKLIKSIMDSVEYKIFKDLNCCEMIKWKRKE